MSRRRKSGFFETLIKSIFGVGQTVHRRKNFWGKNVTEVRYHDTGKTKTYTHRTGFFGNITRTKTKRGIFRTTERGTIKRDLFGNGRSETAIREDGTKIKRQFKPGIFFDRRTTSVVGRCRKCSGTGSVVVGCGLCKGTGSYVPKPKSCLKCKSTGVSKGMSCSPCNGTGVYSREYSCKKCDAVGSLKLTCKKCNGSGKFERFYVN